MMENLENEDAQHFLGTIFGEMKFHIDILIEDMKGVTPELYSKNRIIRGNLYMRLQSIGELVKRISGKSNDQFGLRREFPSFPWDNFKGMRNIIAHAYAKVDIVFPWEAYSEAIPAIENVIQKVCELYPGVKAAMDITVSALSYNEKASIDAYRNMYVDSAEKNTPKLGW